MMAPSRRIPHHFTVPRAWCLALVVVAVLVRLAPSTWDLPHLRFGDEWWGMHAGRALVSDERPSYTHPPLHTWPAAVAALTAPEAAPHKQLIIARMLCVWTLLVSLLGASWLGTQLGGRRGGWLAMLFVALAGTQIRWGMTLDPDPALSALVLVAVAALIWLQRRGGERRALVAGAFVGLAIGAKFTALLLLPVVAWVVVRSPPGSGSPDRRSLLAAALCGIAAIAAGIGMLCTEPPVALARGGVVTPWLHTAWTGSGVALITLGALLLALRGTGITAWDVRRHVALGLAWGLLGGLALALLPALADPLGFLHGTSDQLRTTVGHHPTRNTLSQVILRTPPIWILPFVLAASAWVARRMIRPAEVVTLLGLPVLLIVAILSSDRVYPQYFLCVETLVLAAAGGWLGSALTGAGRFRSWRTAAAVGVLGIVLIGTMWGRKEPVDRLAVLRGPEAASLFEVMSADPGPLVVVPPAPMDRAYAELADVRWIRCIGSKSKPPQPPSSSEQRRIDAARYIVTRHRNRCLPFLRPGAEERRFGPWVLLDRGAEGPR